MELQDETLKGVAGGVTPLGGDLPTISMGGGSGDVALSTTPGTHQIPTTDVEALMTDDMMLNYKLDQAGTRDLYLAAYREYGEMLTLWKKSGGWLGPKPVPPNPADYL